MHTTCWCAMHMGISLLSLWAGGRRLGGTYNRLAIEMHRCDYDTSSMMILQLMWWVKYNPRVKMHPVRLNLCAKAPAFVLHLTPLKQRGGYGRLLFS